VDSRLDDVVSYGWIGAVFTKGKGMRANTSSSAGIVEL
jgi:hypothetical protein